MFLKNYQVKVVSELKAFYGKARETKDAFDNARKTLPSEMRHTLNWVQTAFQTTGKDYKDRCTNGLGEYYPRIIMKVPTGGGKTLLAVEAIREYQNLFARKRTGLVVWIVPSETIYSQTLQKLRDKANPLRQLLDQSSGNKTLILEKGQRLTTHDIEENLVILFVMIQSISRQNGKEALKVFQDSGGFESFFPPDNRYDLHAELLKECPNIDLLSEIGPIVKTSLGNAIRLSKPFIIIDEIHRVFSEMARKTIDGLNPEMVLGLSATPKAEMNILVTISGLELKDEEMVKLDMHIIPPSGRKEDDWKTMLQEIKAHRDLLEKKAGKYRQDAGLYIRPIALIQVEATGKDQRGRGRVHSLDVKEFLQELKINPDEIAVKTSAQNDIEDVNLFARDCNIRYLITKEALREGWDCSFAYILGVIPNVNSDTGITQLVGRILRQPFARKIGIPELDESYVYYSKGDTRAILERVDAGFRNEGLEDLISKIKVQDNEAINPTKKVKIRREFRAKYESAFYLPVWVMVDDGNGKRRFSYELDIKPYIDFSSFKISDSIMDRLTASFSAETKERQSIVVTLDKQSKVAASYEFSEVNGAKEINIDYLTRRYTELTENPFYARRLAAAHTEKLTGRFGKARVEENFGYICAFLYALLSEEKSKIEERFFLDQVKAKKIVLAVSDDPALKYKIPDEDHIVVGRVPNPYKYYLFDDVDIISMNSLEQKIGDILDKQEKILWWFRNKVTKQWYSIQGWQEYKIRPDFVAAKKNEKGEMEIVYILESKGEHLSGNADTVYKKKVLDVMTDQNKKKAIRRYEQMELPFGGLNDNVEFYLVEQGKEDQDLKKFFK
ncbi:MAG: restriction endonuclease subunit R [Desulfobacteraceae bacterium]|nr:MAG: restriction endonuclease subunit R [Desulfobacteraceae bacterium]